MQSAIADAGAAEIFAQSAQFVFGVNERVAGAQELLRVKAIQYRHGIPRSLAIAALCRL